MMASVIIQMMTMTTTAGQIQTNTSAEPTHWTTPANQLILIQMVLVMWSIPMMTMTAIQTRPTLFH